MCCSTIDIDGGTVPNCTGTPVVACTAPSACPTTIVSTSCTGTQTLRLCKTNADCTESTYDQCCTFTSSGGSLTFCANSTIGFLGGGNCQ